MANRCEICGKAPHSGYQFTRRGLAKSKGGVGRKTTGHTKRRFLPNLQVVKAGHRRRRAARARLRQVPAERKGRQGRLSRDGILRPAVPMAGSQAVLF